MTVSLTRPKQALGTNRQIHQQDGLFSGNIYRFFRIACDKCTNCRLALEHDTKKEKPNQTDGDHTHTVPGDTLGVAQGLLPRGVPSGGESTNPSMCPSGLVSDYRPSESGTDLGCYLL